MSTEILRQILIKQAQAEKKVDPKAAKGAVAGAATAALTDKYKTEEALRDSIRVARKSGVGEDQIEGLVGSAIVGHVAPRPDEGDVKMEAVPAPMSARGLGATLAEKASAAREMLKAAIAKCPGGKIRSKGMGRGLGRGRGKGPMGVPGGQEKSALDPASLAVGAGAMVALPAAVRRLLASGAKRKAELIRRGMTKANIKGPWVIRHPALAQMLMPGRLRTTVRGAEAAGRKVRESAVLARYA